MPTSKRYSGQVALPQIGAQGQQRLADATVLVVGAGGLGCAALPYLATAGIGKIIVVDFDTIAETNLNRQILFTPKEVGKHKAQTAADKIYALNPKIKVKAINDLFTLDLGDKYIPQCDVLLDCTDRPDARYIINDACVKHGVPFVYAGIYRFEGQLAVFNHKNGPTYRCAFPENEKNLTGTSCSESGVVGFVPGVLGVLQAGEAIKLIATPDAVNGHLRIFDFLNNHTRSIEIERQRDGTEATAPQTMREIDARALIEQMKSGKAYHFIDVREVFEPAPPDELQGFNLPMSEWDADKIADLLDDDAPTVLYCQHGIRSVAAIATLPEEQKHKIINLTGGLASYLNEKTLY